MNHLPAVPALTLDASRAASVLHSVIHQSGIPGAQMIDIASVQQITGLLYHFGGVVALRDGTQLNVLYLRANAQANHQAQQAAVHQVPAFQPPAPAGPPTPVAPQPTIPSFAPPGSQAAAPFVQHAPHPVPVNVPMAPRQPDQSMAAASAVIDVVPLG